MKQIINIIIVVTLGIVIALTGIFAILQLQRSQAVDERLVSSLTSTLDTVAIQQALTKITQPVDTPPPIDKAK